SVPAACVVGKNGATSRYRDGCDAEHIRPNAGEHDESGRSPVDSRLRCPPVRMSGSDRRRVSSVVIEIGCTPLVGACTRDPHCRRPRRRGRIEPVTRTGTSLARLGLTEPWAEPTVTGLGWWAGDRPAEGAEAIMWALGRSPDPDLALRALERLLTAAPDRAELDAALRTDQVLRGRLISLLGSSTALGDHLVTHPDRWHRLTASAPPPGKGAKEAILRAVGVGGDVLTGADAVAALRLAYRDEVLALAAADLAAVAEPDLPVLDVADVAAHLSDLADAALQAAYAVAAAEVGPAGRLAVIAMGKCGGRELNYVSDVDVVFVAEPADQQTTRLASRLMRIAGEACFQVDANLRPEGRQGALVRTLDGHLTY